MAKSPTSSSSWPTTSAGSTSAPITAASWPAGRRTSTGSPREGMLFTDYYAEASCTAGRANFITGQLPIRTGLTTVGQAGVGDRHAGRGADDRHRAQVDGLRHRSVRQEPPRRPQRVPADGARLRRVLRLPLSPRRDGRSVPSQLPAGAQGHGRSAQHGALAGPTDKDDPTEQPRWGKVGKQKIEDAGALYPKRMETVDDEILDHAFKFMDKAKGDGKPFFVWLNPTRMHVVTHLSEKYEKMRTPENGWSIYEAGMAQLDDIVGAVMKKLDDLGVDDDTIVVFTTDNGAENFTWPDGGQTPFAGGKGTVLEGGFRVPCIVRWPGTVPAGKVENELMSGLDWFPTLVAAAGDPNIVDELKKGKKLGDRTYKMHLDGYDQIDLITGKGPSKRQGDLLLRRGDARRRAHRRLQVPLHRSAATAGSAARSSPTGRSSRTSASIRSSAPA